MQKRLPAAAACAVPESLSDEFFYDRTHRGIRELCLAVCRLNFL